MTLQVDVLARYPMPAVRAVVTGVPAGTGWTLHGVAADDEWLVASGVSTGDEVVTADPWAPIGAPASYRLSYGSVVEVEGPVLRHYRGGSAITDTTGHTVVDFAWMRAGGDPRSGERRGHFSKVSGARFAPARLDPVAGAGGGSLRAQTVQPHTDTLRRLLGGNKPLILMHNRARCEVPGCDTPAVQTVWFTGDDNDRVPRPDAAHREWSLSYRLLPSGVIDGVVPVVTLGDVRDAFPTLGDLSTTGMTLGDLVRGDWLFQ